MRNSAAPYSIFQFDAGFEDRQQAKRFRYGVNGALRFQNSAYTKTLRPVDASEKDALFGMIESAARRVLSDLRAKNVKERSETANNQGAVA